MAKYVDQVNKYLLRRFVEHGAKIRRDVQMGITVVGKPRTVDLLMTTDDGKGLAVMCVYQVEDASEQVAAVISDLKAMPMPAVLVYGGTGFCDGLFSLLKCCQFAARFESAERGDELAQCVAMQLGWWDAF